MFHESNREGNVTFGRESEGYRLPPREARFDERLKAQTRHQLRDSRSLIDGLPRDWNRHDTAIHRTFSMRRLRFLPRRRDWWNHSFVGRVSAPRSSFVML
jgi:hypothetical protein